ncbi:polyprenyl synthetase family protein [Streptomyces sp. TRM72054]|uniref:polyprenyl synthetase family protein n=1 Tax=Streptomyces sp. TRM72054 TaxID=2870562 RepID=UPI001C8CD218|nr:polyprenyl synthetase family protein [Streptomyces sp. TRM72054]MBX9399533.1 polyprenyl synthetase family protein [Streptomyces sp. TRM72054]
MDLWWMGAEAIDDCLDGAIPDSDSLSHVLAAGVAALQTLPVLVLSRANLPSGIRCSLLGELAQASLASYEGQIRDIDTPLDGLKVEHVLKIYRGKTGVAWLVAARMSAIAAGASADTVSKWGRLGECVGVLRQLLNDRADLLDGRDEDIRNGTPTLLLANALSSGSQEQRSELLQLYSRVGEDADSRSRVKQIILQPENVRRHLAYSSALRKRARSLLEELAPEEPFAQPVYDLIETSSGSASQADPPDALVEDELGRGPADPR